MLDFTFCPGARVSNLEYCVGTGVNNCYSMCLARGRPFLVPITRSLKDCDNWHKSPLADKQDGPLLSMAVLRRDLDGLFTTVRALCDGSQTVSSDGSLIAQS